MVLGILHVQKPLFSFHSTTLGSKDPAPNHWDLHWGGDGNHDGPAAADDPPADAHWCDLQLQWWGRNWAARGAGSEIRKSLAVSSRNMSKHWCWYGSHTHVYIYIHNCVTVYDYNIIYIYISICVCVHLFIHSLTYLFIPLLIRFAPLHHAGLCWWLRREKERERGIYAIAAIGYSDMLWTHTFRDLSPVG